MATPYRTTVQIDSVKFDAFSVEFKIFTLKDKAGMPQMGTLGTKIVALADFHDTTNLPYSSMQTLFNLANVVSLQNIKPITITFWQDDSKQNALCAYSFNGWISKFKTTNPMADASDADGELSATSTINHLLYLELEPALDQKNFTSLKISN
jgi:hypothetical protein